MRVLLHSLRKTYLNADPRSLGLFRIGFGFVLCWDLLRRYEQIDFWYTNTGLLPNHTLLWRPPAKHVFSLFFAASSRAEASVGFALCAAVYVMFVLGYRTRFMHVLALLCRVSLNSRLAVLENGGDMVMNLLCVLSLPLPLGRRFSLDACRERYAEDAPELRAPVTSLAMFALISQFTAIYFFNAVSKDGEAWKHGYAVHYALHQDKYVTTLGVFVREHVPFGAFKLFTWGTLSTEWTGFALLITPFFVHRARAIAVLLMPMLHLCFALGLNLGTFSPAMMSFFPLLLTSVHWQFLNDRVASSRRLSGVVTRARAVGVGIGTWLLPERVAGPGPRREYWKFALRWSSEVAVVALMFAIATEALNDNTSVPKWLQVRQPEWAKAAIEYPRLLQGWRMFAPEPPMTDSMIYIDATTAEGRRVDPYNEVASRQRFPGGDVVPVRMDQSQFFTMYSDRIAFDGYAAYRQAFLEWLLAYPARTGRSSDCLVSFEAFYVSDRTPAPGERGRSAPIERRSFMQYVAPSDGGCKALAPKPDQRPLQAHSG